MSLLYWGARTGCSIPDVQTLDITKRCKFLLWEYHNTSICIFACLQDTSYYRSMIASGDITEKQSDLLAPMQL